MIYVVVVVAEYEDSHLSGETRYLGAVIGRVLRGTAGASFVLDNVVYNVSDSTSGWHKVMCDVVLLTYTAPVGGGRGR